MFIPLISLVEQNSFFESQLNMMARLSRLLESVHDSINLCFQVQAVNRCRAPLGYELSRVNMSQENRKMLIISDPLHRVICSLLTGNFKHLLLYSTTAALRYCFQNPLRYRRGEEKGLHP